VRPGLLLLGLALVASAAFAEEPVRVVLPNGMRLIAKPDPGTEIVALDLLLDVSAADEPDDKVGIRLLTQRLLLRGTRNESGDSMAQRLVAAGASADVSVGLDYVELYVLAPADAFTLALAALADVVRAPAFLPEEVDRQKEGAAELAQQSLTDPFQAAYLALRQGLYPGDPYSRPTLGTPSSLRSISREDVIAFHGKHYRPGRTVLAVCGGLGAARAIRAARAAFGDWPAGTVPERHPGPASAPSPDILVRELPTRQAHLLLGSPAPAAGQPGYCALQVLDALLSGGASARLPKLLRERLGLAYDVSSFYPTLAGPSHFGLYVVTDPYQVEAARAAVVGLLKALAREPVSSPDLERAKRYLLGSNALAHQRMKDQAYSFAWYEILALGWDFDRRYADGIRAVTADQVQEAAQALLGGLLIALAMPME